MFSLVLSWSNCTSNPNGPAQAYCASARVSCKSQGRYGGQRCLASNFKRRTYDKTSQSSISTMVMRPGEDRRPRKTRIALTLWYPIGTHPAYALVFQALFLEREPRYSTFSLALPLGYIITTGIPTALVKLLLYDPTKDLSLGTACLIKTVHF